MNRIAPFAQQDLILYNTQLTQQRVFKAQLQLGSGKVSQDYAGIAQRAARLVSIEAAILRVQQFTQTISLVDQRLSLADIAMQSIDDIARQLRGIVKSLDDAPAERYSELREFAINARTVIVESLNTSDATRHLFGGTRIDTPPVDVSSPYRNVSLIQADGAVDQTFYDSYYVEVLGNTLPYAQGSFYQQIYFDKNGVLPTVPVPADLNNPTLAEFVAEDPALWQYYVDRIDSTQMLATPKLDYYKGDNRSQAARISENQTLNYGISASAPAFQQLLMAVDALASMPATAPATTFLKPLIDKTAAVLAKVLTDAPGDGFESLGEIWLRLTIPRTTLATVREGHERFAAYADGVVSEIESIDRAEVITRVQTDQLALEASYTALARISSLSLLDFLR